MVSISGLPPPVAVVGKTAYFWQFFSKEHIFKSWNIRSYYKEYTSLKAWHRLLKEEELLPPPPPSPTAISQTFTFIPFNKFFRERIPTWQTSHFIPFIFPHFFLRRTHKLWKWPERMMTVLNHYMQQLILIQVYTCFTNPKHKIVHSAYFPAE